MLSLYLFFELKIGTGLQQKKYNADEQNKINKAPKDGYVNNKQRKYHCSINRKKGNAQ